MGRLAGAAGAALALLAGLAAEGAAQPRDGRFGFGRPAAPDEIAAWDIDVMPDGAGLPEGSGTAESGAPVYAAQCAVCHGPAGEGGVADRLVGYDPESTPPFGPRYEAWRAGRDDVAFSVGNYWPYATTLFDYIRRAMPSDAPGTLAPDEVYGLVAWILAENGIVAADAVMNAETLPAVEMPARDIFVPQERRSLRRGTMMPARDIFVPQERQESAPRDDFGPIGYPALAGITSCWGPNLLRRRLLAWPARARRDP